MKRNRQSMKLPSMYLLRTIIKPIMTNIASGRRRGSTTVKMEKLERNKLFELSELDDYGTARSQQGRG